MNEEGHPELLKIDIEEWHPTGSEKDEAAIASILPRLTALKKESLQLRDPEIPQERLQRSMEYLESRLRALKPGDVVLMARSNAEIVGFQLVRWNEEEKRIQIEQVYTDIKYARRGIGENLVRRAIEHARQVQSGESKGIFLTTGRGNMPAQRLYTKTGFHISNTLAKDEGEIRMEFDFETEPGPGRQKSV